MTFLGCFVTGGAVTSGARYFCVFDATCVEHYSRDGSNGLDSAKTKPRAMQAQVTTLNRSVHAQQTRDFNPVPFDLLPTECHLSIAVDFIGARTHAEGEVPFLSEAILNTFPIMERRIFRGKLPAAAPDLDVNVEVSDVRVLEFYKAVEVLTQDDDGPRPSALRTRKVLESVCSL